MRRCEVIMWLGLLCKMKVEMFLGCLVCIEALRGLVWVETLGCLVCDELVSWSLVCVEILRGLICIELILGGLTCVDVLGSMVWIELMI
jgi:hypothetical protein